MNDKSQVFADLLLKSHRDLFGFIYSLVQNLQDAEDVYQETTAILWQKFDDFTLGTSFSAWAMRVAQLRVLKHAAARRKERLFFHDDLLNSIAEAYQRDAANWSNRRADALAGCMEKLSDKERRLVMRCYAPDRNYADIARQEGRTVGALYQALNRIRKALHACIERSLALESH